jgi:hypothetical protein
LIYSDDGVLSSDDKKCIDAQETNSKKNRVLIDVLSRKSLSVYDKFLQVLKDVGQEHIAAEQEGLEVVAQVSARFNASPGISADQQKDIMGRMRNAIEALITRNEPNIRSDHLVRLMEQRFYNICRWRKSAKN